MAIDLRMSRGWRWANVEFEEDSTKQRKLPFSFRETVLGGQLGDSQLPLPLTILAGQQSGT